MDLGKITIIGEDLAAESVGIMGFMPSSRHLVLARDDDHANHIIKLFKNKFSIEISIDYMSELVGRRLGVVALAFSDDHGKVRSSEDIVEVPDIDKARAELPQIRTASGPHSRDTGSPFR